MDEQITARLVGEGRPAWAVGAVLIALVIGVPIGGAVAWKVWRERVHHRLSA